MPENIKKEDENDMVLEEISSALISKIEDILK